MLDRKDVLEKKRGREEMGIASFLCKKRVRLEYSQPINVGFKPSVSLKVLDYLCTLIFDLYDQHLRFIRFIRYSVLIIQGLQDYIELLFRLQALLLCRRCLCLSGTAEAALAAIVG